MNYKYSYLIKFQYLGFRFHGWQKQPGLKTVHWALDKTMKFVCKGVRQKTIGIGRTDAKVSSNAYMFQLFIDEELPSNYIEKFNINSPADIKVISFDPIHDGQFNIIQHPKVKEYHYYFSFGEKNHPYAAPFLVGFLDTLNIEMMQQGAKLFSGEHNFRMYCTKPSEATQLVRKIDECSIVLNTKLTASFFPEVSYVLIVRGKGFLRNQIRLIMGALVELGKGNVDIDFIERSLTGAVIEDAFIKNIAPASGLHLYDIAFKD